MQNDTNEWFPVISLLDASKNPPSLPGILIEGVLYEGNKLLVCGPSKSGKTTLMLELAIAIAGGTSWIGYNCRQGVVLYLSLEVDYAHVINRFNDILESTDLTVNLDELKKKIHISNLRGRAAPLNELKDGIINTVKSIGEPVVAIIVDPIYKVITGDENSATEMTKFLNIFDEIIKETGAAIISVHHHTKGSQKGKSAMDRGSGSGVFARDVDALIDLTELTLKKEAAENPDYDGKYGFKVETILRYFQSPEPYNIWYDYPLHYIDEDDILRNARIKDESRNTENLKNTSKYTTPEQREQSVEESFTMCNIGEKVTIHEMAQYIGCDVKTVRNYIKEYNGNAHINEYIVENSFVTIRRKS